MQLSAPEDLGAAQEYGLGPDTGRVEAIGAEYRHRKLEGGIEVHRIWVPPRPDVDRHVGLLTRVPDAIAVGVRLIRITDRGTVVREVRDSVSVGVDRNHHGCFRGACVRRT